MLDSSKAHLLKVSIELLPIMLLQSIDVPVAIKVPTRLQHHQLTSNELFITGEVESISRRDAAVEVGFIESHSSKQAYQIGHASCCSPS